MLLSIVVPTYCEELNIEKHYDVCIKAIHILTQKYSEPADYEYIVIDNNSPDNTVDAALRLKQRDDRVKILVNDRNYGAILSPYAGMLYATGDAVLVIVADMQEPPEMLLRLFPPILEGYDASIGFKGKSKEIWVSWLMRGFYYSILRYINMTALPYRFSGFGIYSRKLIEAFKTDNLPEPSLRVLLPRNAKKINSVEYEHGERLAGKSSYSIYAYTREAVKNIVRNAVSMPKLLGKLAGIAAIMSLAALPILVVIKITMWQSLAPGIASFALLTLFLNSCILGALALILDRIEQVLLRTQPIRTAVHRKRIY
jgi:polyisoprenyl-phosphate glycosyltransferase